MGADLQDTRRTVADVIRDVSNIQAKLGLVDDIDLISSTHNFKCKGGKSAKCKQIFFLFCPAAEALADLPHVGSQARLSGTRGRCGR